MEFSATDIKILTLLQRDAGISNVALAEQVGMSPSPCLRRVKQLEEAGVIRKRVALIDRKKAGSLIMCHNQIKNVLPYSHVCR